MLTYSAGGMALSSLVPSTVNFLSMLARSSAANLQIWSLHGLLLTIESAGLSYLSHVQVHLLKCLCSTVLWSYFPVVNLIWITRYLPCGTWMEVDYGRRVNGPHGVPKDLIKNHDARLQYTYKIVSLGYMVHWHTVHLCLVKYYMWCNLCATSGISLTIERLSQQWSLYNLGHRNCG